MYTYTQLLRDLLITARDPWVSADHWSLSLRPPGRSDGRVFGFVLLSVEVL